MLKFPSDSSGTNSNIQQQYLALHESVAILDLNHEEIYSLTGEDRKNFLNSYNTQDIKTLGEYQTTYGAFLTQKGKLISDSTILLLSEKILLLLQPGYGKKLEQHLATYLMFANVHLEEESKKWTHVALIGPKTESILREVLSIELPLKEKEIKHHEFEGKPLFIFQSQRLGLPAWEILTVGTIHELPLQTIPSIGHEMLEIIRVEAGLPKMGVDMTEDNLVAEIGLDSNATSFNKGCYLGQEITARVQSRGHVNKKLLQFKIVGAVREPPLPLDIFQGEKTVGQLTSAVPSPKFKCSLGLGTLHLQALENPEKLFVKGPQGNIELQKIS